MNLFKREDYTVTGKENPVTLHETILSVLHKDHFRFGWLDKGSKILERPTELMLPRGEVTDSYQVFFQFTVSRKFYNEEYFKALGLNVFESQKNAEDNTNWKVTIHLQNNSIKTMEEINDLYSQVMAELTRIILISK